MAEGVIDSATLFEVVTYSRRDKPVRDWASRGAEAATSALRFSHHLRVPRSPVRSGESSGPYRILMSGVESLGTSLSVEFSDVSGIASQRTREWARANADSVAQAMAQLERDSFFHRWREAEVRWAWAEYANRRNGLLTEAYLGELAPILGLGEADLHEIHSRTIDPGFVKMIVKERPQGDFETLCRAYVAVTLIRGRYYCELARLSSQQLLQHPLRTADPSRRLTSDLFRTNYQRFSSSLAETLFTKLLIVSIFAEKTVDGRIRLWLENIARARPALLNTNTEPRRRLRTYHSRPSVARDEALRVAKNLDIRTYPKYLEQAFDAAVGISSSAVTSFVLQPWAAFAAGMAGWLASQHGGGQIVARVLANRRGRLERLLTAPAGRLDAP
jgi:hypothetical protein